MYVRACGDATQAVCVGGRVAPQRAIRPNVCEGTVPGEEGQEACVWRRRS